MRPGCLDDDYAGSSFPACLPKRVSEFLKLGNVPGARPKPLGCLRQVECQVWAFELPEVRLARPKLVSEPMADA